MATKRTKPGSARAKGAPRAAGKSAAASRPKKSVVKTLDTWAKRRNAKKAVKLRAKLARKSASVASKAARAARKAANAANRATRYARRAKAVASMAAAAGIEPATPEEAEKAKKHSLKDAGEHIMKSAFKGAIQGALAGAIDEVREVLPGRAPDEIAQDAALLEQEINPKDDEKDDEV